MEQQDNNPGHQFAQLTGLLEDAAGLAAERQGTHVPALKRLELIKSLTKLNRESQSILDTLHTQLSATQ